MLRALFLAAAVATATPTLPTQWEYTVIEAYGINPGPTQEFFGLKSEPTAKLLNRLGAQGWELVTVTRAAEGERVYMFLKREIPKR
ncbi:MAG: hypothetical protein JWM80_2698 [Cyanobacteria bacterium RYN_339]|nr:hypothetical protein [Cyanobacteria bacterium RYN_339]